MFKYHRSKEVKEVDKKPKYKKKRESETVIEFLNRKLIIKTEYIKFNKED